MIKEQGTVELGHCVIESLCRWITLSLCFVMDRHRRNHSVDRGFRISDNQSFVDSSRLRFQYTKPR